MNEEEPYDPQPISLEDAKRIWKLQKQKKKLSMEDAKLASQSVQWQMWVSHGIKLQNGDSESTANSKPSGTGAKKLNAS